VRRHKRVPGIFQHLVGKATFVDMVDLALWGVRRAVVGAHIATQTSRAIGGPGRAYARCIPGLNTPTGNQLQFKHGKMVPYGNVSPFVVHLWADRQPVTCADALLAIDGFLRLGCRAKVSKVELTFDTEGIPLERFSWELCTSARTFREFQNANGPTLYVGGVNSPWQLRIYQKTYAIVRTEFTLRSTFLRKYGIVRPHELSFLRRARLWDHVSFLKVDQSQGYALPARTKALWNRIGRGLPPNMPASIIRAALRESRINPSRWVVRSPREELLRQMLKNLVW
jgi:hypothetical protein